MCLGWCWCKTGFNLAAAADSPVQVGMSEEQCTLTKEMCWPYSLWRCSHWRNLKLQRGWSEGGGRAHSNTDIWATRKERFQLSWQPHCMRGSEEKLGDLTGTNNTSYSLISSAAQREQHAFACRCSCQEIWHQYQLWPRPILFALLPCKKRAVVAMRSGSMSVCLHLSPGPMG